MIMHYAFYTFTSSVVSLLAQHKHLHIVQGTASLTSHSNNIQLGFAHELLKVSVKFRVTRLAIELVTLSTAGYCLDH